MLKWKAIMPLTTENPRSVSGPESAKEDSSHASRQDPRQIYIFGEFRLDPSNRLLTSNGREIPLAGRIFDLLLYLVQRPGQLLMKDDLLNVVWEGAFVEESSLTVAISALRRALNDDPHIRLYIQTVARRGYRFIAGVHRVESMLISPPSAPISGASEPEEALVPPAIAASPESSASMSEEEESLHQAGTRKRGRWWPLFCLYAALLAILSLGVWRLLMPQRALQSLAVLPVTAASAGDHAFDEVELLGTTDALVSRIENEMVVRPTSSVLRYAASGAVDPVVAGQEQDVDAVLVGLLSSDGTNDVLQLKLVRVRDGLTLWQDVFRAHGLNELQAAAGDAVARRMHSFGAKASTHPATAESPLARANNPAYQLYIRGRYFWNLRTEDGLRKAAACFRQAIDADPNYAPAYAGLADSYALLASFSVEPGSLSNADARSAALSAIHLDPTLAEPHASLGMILFFTDWNVRAAEVEFERAIALNPNYATAHHWYALDLAAMGRFPEALYEARVAQKLDPLSLIINTNVGWIEYLAHDYTAATADLHRVLEMDPTFARARTRLGMVELSEGDYADAIQDFKQALASSGDQDPYVEGLLGYAEADNGHPADAQHILDDLQRRQDTSYVPPISRALVMIGLQRRQEAIIALGQTIQDHSTSMVYAKVDPTLDPLRNEAAFQTLLRSMPK
jgi:DNA-binding winged helix-turn-helix (wHTH) protein/Tfp pilus assembly protein PilF/TolB-like protein